MCLDGHAYEQGGVTAAVLLHFALNATSVLLQVSQPVENTVALVVVVGVAVLVETRERRRIVPLQQPAAVALPASASMRCRSSGRSSSVVNCTRPTIDTP